MASRLKDIQFGSVDIDNFARFINERHNIYINRFIKNQPKPWTNDEILQTYKFTNVFRQLDKGTIALTEMLNKYLKFTLEMPQPELIFFNICWYRYFNLDIHAKNLSFVYSYDKVEKYILERAKNKQRIFTSAWMTHGSFAEPKHITYLKGLKECWNRRFEFVDFIKRTNSIELLCAELLNLPCIGKFLAYEIACDLRFTKLLENATDKYTWANLGPGAQRGLKRLGYPHKNQEEACASMCEIYKELTSDDMYLSPYVCEHFPTKVLYMKEPPFELREVEHSLCEFDKYCRVKFGEGRPRSKYDGV